MAKKISQRSLIIGAGEVGKALNSVLENSHDQVFIRGTEDLKLSDVFFLHICFPYSDNFVEKVREYIKQYTPVITVVHSTVPVGTTRKIGGDVIHSPIRGKHPHLAKSIWTFVKMIGGSNADNVKTVARYFERAKIKTHLFDKSETTEAAKLWDLYYYGLCIVFQKEVKEFCDKNGLSFTEVYTIPNDYYNLGWARMGESRYIRPVLEHMPGKIGGHCVIQNCPVTDSWVPKLIMEKNERY